MWKPDLCIYHGGCDDGFASATVARLKWPGLVCVGAMHNKPIPVDVAGKAVLMVDFSYKHEVMKSAPWRSCIILDHHETAAAELEPFQVDWIMRFGADTIGNVDGTHAHFDMTKSGAMLTWNFCFPNKEAPEFIRCIQARDLWHLTEEVKQFSAAVRSYPQDFDIWEEWVRYGDKSALELVEEGRPLVRSHLMVMAKILREAHELLFKPEDGGPKLMMRVPAVNCPYHYASDAAHLLLEQNPGAPFAAAYFRRSDGRRQFSLRSEDGRFSVSDVAKRYGGGGHRNSSGFDVQWLGDIAPASIPAAYPLGR